MDRKRSRGDEALPNLRAGDVSKAGQSEAGADRNAEGAGKRKRPRDQQANVSHRDDHFEEDEEAHLLLRSGDVLDGRYVVRKCSGTGTFGKVYLCDDRTTGTKVAVKAIRRVRRYVESAKIEKDLLEDVNRAMPLPMGPKGVTIPIVRYERSFDCHGHYCMVFEALGPSLYDYVKANEYRPMPLYAVQSCAEQLITAVGFLHEIRLVHTDLKLENILLTSLGGDGQGGRVFKKTDKDTSARDGRHVLAPLSTSIKLIDFGGATYDYDNKSFLVNTRQYRSPEVILGLGWGPPSDMWSLGCILMELYKGELLFATHDNAEHLALMERVLGPFPPAMLRGGSRLVSKYFDGVGRQRFPESARNRDSVRRVKSALPLEGLVNGRDIVFLDLVRKMLAVDPRARITARDALNHRFFTIIRKGAIEPPIPREMPAAQRGGRHPPASKPKDTGEDDEASDTESDSDPHPHTRVDASGAHGRSPSPRHGLAHTNARRGSGAGASGNVASVHEGRVDKRRHSDADERDRYGVHTHTHAYRRHGNEHEYEQRHEGEARRVSGSRSGTGAGVHIDGGHAHAHVHAGSRRTAADRDMSGDVERDDGHTTGRRRDSWSTGGGLSQLQSGRGDRDRETRNRERDGGDKARRYSGRSDGPRLLMRPFVDGNDMAISPARPFRDAGDAARRLNGDVSPTSVIYNEEARSQIRDRGGRADPTRMPPGYSDEILEAEVVYDSEEEVLEQEEVHDMDGDRRAKRAATPTELEAVSRKHSITTQSSATPLVTATPMAGAKMPVPLPASSLSLGLASAVQNLALGGLGVVGGLLSKFSGSGSGGVSSSSVIGIGSAGMPGLGLDNTVGGGVNVSVTSPGMGTGAPRQVGSGTAVPSLLLVGTSPGRALGQGNSAAPGGRSDDDSDVVLIVPGAAHPHRPAGLAGMVNSVTAPQRPAGLAGMASANTAQYRIVGLQSDSVVSAGAGGGDVFVPYDEAMAPTMAPGSGGRERERGYAVSSSTGAMAAGGSGHANARLATPATGLASLSLSGPRSA